MPTIKTPANTLEASHQPANRLIIGDVGSGKTLVAIMSLLSYLESFYHQSQSDGRAYQVDVAFMAPTEVLAAQHYFKIQELLPPLELDWLDVFLVTNKNRYFNGQKVSKKQIDKYLEDSLDFTFFDKTADLKPDQKPKTDKTSKKTAPELPSKPRLCIWIGTQALLFLEKLNPAMVVTDEQHRFGVKQRQTLSSLTKPNSNTLNQTATTLAAHYVSMTATPIPRTLALTVYGDLQTSYVKKIATRSPIITKIIEQKDFEQKILPILQEKLSLGQKMYIICPLIENEDSSDPATENLWTLLKAKNLLSKYFKEEIITSLHGKLTTKHDILNEFKTNPLLQILIATTVIEVGVDVADATIMLILNPERFGLAQLHQIRGRIGRNDLPQNFCFLLIDEPHTAFLPRLRYLCQSNDGFEIAQEDLRLRGQGDLFGTTQSGQNEDLIGLSVEQYTAIRKTVDLINMGSVASDFPLLDQYLVTESNQVWGE